MPHVAHDLRCAVEGAVPRLLRISEPESAVRPAPERWSPREILGHLIDSAASNHVRFVRAQLQEDLVFPGYDQDAWVACQRYRDAAWPALVELWRAYNLHLVRVMEAAPEEVRRRPRTRHNLREIGWRPVPPEEPATLEHLMRDYVGHLQHHLDQILPT